ncbi:creatinine amidohydrolase ArfB [Methanobrevibacter ruminantium M1]|uniref:2-amino-5-formylamino-6-ribosylaminopyrimidin-4(3H)-one 5'-monophosphate deformylase n=1 Tax=Methanobrevibacter ruminantium (strain ATCC 35063 / DSM 1093 / JCM 13430 / OCM 146 / M1) TaxID=634498 RepID=ARFB_METRM|nr:2-amino-5-formylamino-6-ribosylaminopyrimidin-4(3H)-one 5'-monophosphate deformylase [Methanobrevibacter ruminantium]D3E3M2.1 RecName: Full=2-amino-5-formylamino-6-ribosylaminopyrimidin-4(3H)-one 5'-monophosphate deformylase; Short=FAPy deformylase; AltName: Full=Formamide hydrolase [Methanobrevibacter ruminantium M1]ADC47133.1 creatinine amidohydrolase ArfB [Methanobrevibacter ruminantium M1]
MVELRVNAGNVKNPNVHKIGIIALGSHLENHGPALPIDTDAKIASHIAFQASLESGAKFLGVIYPAHELKEINHGIHVSLEDLTDEIVKVLKSAKKFLRISSVIIVNGHGGNLPIVTTLYDIEERTGLLITLNSKIIESEGPHGGSGELSMAKALGIIDESQVENQTNLEEYGEVGLYMFGEARRNDPNIEEGALDVEENGVYVDDVYGQELLKLAINSVLLDVEKQLDSHYGY